VVVERREAYYRHLQHRDESTVFVTDLLFQLRLDPSGPPARIIATAFDGFDAGSMASLTDTDVIEGIKEQKATLIELTTDAEEKKNVAAVNAVLLAKRLLGLRRH